MAAAFAKSATPRCQHAEDQRRRYKPEIPKGLGTKSSLRRRGDIERVVPIGRLL
jgi:hypothetical protein